MNKVLRASAVVAAAGLAVPLWAVPAAFAAATTEPAATGAYFYSMGIDKPEQSPTQPPPITQNNTDMVAPEHLAVAVRIPGQVDKLSFLSFDLATVPFDATITKAVVSIPLAENGNGNTQQSPAPERVRACMAGDEGFNGEDGANTAGAPSALCDKFAVVAKEGADKKSYDFDVSALAASWLTEANNGMALTPATLTSPFQVVFKPFSEAKIAITFTAPPEEVVTDVVMPDAPATPVDSGSGFSGDAGSFDSGTSTDLGTGFGSVEAPATLDTAVAAPETTDTAEPDPTLASQPTQISNVASTQEAPLTPTAPFWLGLLAALGLLGLLGLIMGDPRVASPGATTPSRLSSALQARQRPGGGPRLGRPLSS